MKKYVEKFLAQEIEMDTLPFLTEQHLETLGVSTLGARLRILTAIKALKGEDEAIVKTSDQEVNLMLKETLDNLNSSTNKLADMLKTAMLSQASQSINQQIKMRGQLNPNTSPNLTVSTNSQTIKLLKHATNSSSNERHTLEAENT